MLREKRANLVYCRPNPAAPIYEEFKAIAFKTFGLELALDERNAEFPPNLRLMNSRRRARQESKESGLCSVDWGGSTRPGSLRSWQPDRKLIACV